MKCPNCGGDLTGDGYTTALICENLNWSDFMDKEPDSGPFFCEEK